MRRFLVVHTGYDNPSAPTYENCSFSFMADGKFCSLSLDKLNEIYYISDERREVAVENKLAPTDRFWDLIVNGTFTSRKAYQSQIRNPTLRVIAKIVPTSYSLRIRPRRSPRESCRCCTQGLRTRFAELEPSQSSRFKLTSGTISYGCSILEGTA